MTNQSDVQLQVEAFCADFEALAQEMGRVIVGHQETIRLALTALIVGGHLLVEGLPGTGKTTLIRALAGCLELTFNRVQCTPDLMPADLIGTYVITETPQGRRTFEFQRGPLFANIVLADHINRAMPKTQAAFLEAMDEHAVTVSTETFRLPRPHLVAATQNPLETEGTFPLPEAQIDRFLFKLSMDPPAPEQMELILQRTTDMERAKAHKVADATRITQMGELARQVVLGEAVRRWAVNVVAASHPGNQRAPDEVRRLVRYGAGPRAAQAIVLGAKVRALLEGRCHVSCEDVRAVVHPALRHRVILNYEGQAEETAVDKLIDKVLQSVPAPGPSPA